MLSRLFPAVVLAFAVAAHVQPCIASPDSVVVFNEVQYNPAGQSEAGEWVELFNQMGIKVDISAWRIDGIGYQFPQGTIINPGTYVVVAKTPGAGQFGPYTGNISNTGQRLRLINHSGRMMDEIDFGDDDPWPAGADGSGATLAKILPYTASTPHANWTVSSQTGGTPGTVNFPGGGALLSLRFNEIPASTAPAFWVELLNAGTASIAQGDLIVSAGGDPLREYVLPAGTLVPGGLLLLDEATLGFRPADGEKLFLFTSGKTAVLDARTLTGRLRGRSGSEWAYPNVATPETANSFVFHNGVVISEIQYNPPALAPVAATPATYQTTTLIAFGDTWRYNDTNENLPAGWAATVHPFGGNWKMGPGPIGFEVDPLPVPLGTSLTGYAQATVTYYFEREFTVTALQLATAESLEITHQIDDGAVFYLNGNELPRVGMLEGPVGPETLASPGVGVSAALGSLVIPTTGLQVGSNRMSVEVHQNSTGSSDLVFGMKLDARVQLTPGVPGQPLRNSDNQWIEIANRSAAPVDLTGWDFGDGIDFVFAPDTILAPGEHACVVRDAAIFSAAYPAARVLGTFGGSLSRSGEHLVLRDALRNTADEVRFFDGGPWPEFADGGGSSLELRDLDADNMAGGAWAASDESSRTAWRTYSYRGTAAASNGGPDGQWLEFNMGMLAAGEVWIDDLNVIEFPGAAATQRITDPGFNNAAAWRRLGNHRGSQVIDEPGNPANKILRLVATGPTEHMHNQIETTLNSAVVNGREYEISFRARWVTGASQLHTRLYFNRLAKVNVIDRSTNPGTPGAVNSRAITNSGPTFKGLKHSPPVPAANAITTVSCIAADPDSISTMTLFYSVNGGVFQSTGMTTTGGGLYSAGIPGQAAGAVVQFYIRGIDVPGATEFYPAGGVSSRALYKVNDGTAATTGLHNFRVITTNADRDWMHVPYNVMSNDRIGCTVIDRESDIYYGAGVRLKSSERGRNQLTRVGYNIDFPSDGLFRGVHGSVAVDRSEGQAPGQFELLFDIMISNSGGPISRYYDFIKVLAPHGSLTGGAVLQLARYDDVFLDSQFENGSAGQLYEYELVYYPTTADANGNKLPYPSPDNVIGVGVSNHGDDPERYRWHFLNKINREADDFTPMINYAKQFSKTGAAFESGLGSVIDLDTWFRGLACAVLTGAGDNTAGDGAQHNGNYYARPDGRIIFLPHDMDFAFDANRGIFANSQCIALTGVPARRRLYLGHLQDIISTTYNNAYMSIWTAHFAALDPAQNWSSELSYMTTRSNSVLSQINGQIPPVTFAITTPGPVTVAASTATVAGNGWVNVREIRVLGSTEPLTVNWTGNSTWQVVLPAPPGQSTVTLQVVNFSGTVIGTSTITINNTTTVQPASPQNLVVSEIMYHPADPAPAEVMAGFTDDNFFEYVEVQNISAAVVDLTGVRFTGGIDYDFAGGTMLQPGARLAVVSNRTAFLSRYPGASSTLAAGAFLNGTGLNNAGENITLTTALGTVLRSFTYDDNFPWPAAPDGSGYSLVLIAPATNPDHNLPSNWRSSALPGGHPGDTDAIPFTGTPGTDNDHDGLDALLEHALGTSDNVRGLAEVSAIIGPDGFITFEYARSAAADDVICEVQLSTDLSIWESSVFTTMSDTPLGDGTSLVAARSNLPAPAPRSFTRLHVRLR